MSHFIFWMLVLFLLFRVFVLGYFAGIGAVDPSFFTYQNFMLCTLLLSLLILSSFKTWAFEFFTLFLVPLYWGTTFFVAIAIVVIVHLNGGIFMKTTIDNGGTNPVGKVHTGDWMLHQWPAIEIALILFMLQTFVVQAFHNFYRQLSVWGKIGYTAYFHLVSLAVLAFYMLNFDFVVNYPTPISEAAVYLLVVALALFTELLLFLMLYFAKPSLEWRFAAPMKLKAV